MVTRFTSIWNERKPAGPKPVPRGGAAAASAVADSESGDEGDDSDARSNARSLRALKVMLDRGLMTEAEYEQRKPAISGRKTG